MIERHSEKINIKAIGKGSEGPLQFLDHVLKELSGTNFVRFCSLDRPREEVIKELADDESVYRNKALHKWVVCKDEK